MSVELIRLTKALAGRRLLVVGDVMLDEYVWGTTDRVSPEAPVPVVRIENETKELGGAANAAAGAAALGGRVVFAGLVGEDIGAGAVRDMCDRVGIDHRFVIAADRPTTVKTRIVANHQQVSRIDREETGELSASAEANLIDIIRRTIDDVDCVLLSDYAKGLATPGLVTALMDAGRARGLPIVVDPKGLRFAKYRGATVIKPNEREAFAAVGMPHVSGSVALSDVAARLQEELDGSAVLITRGPEGMSLFAPGRKPFNVASSAVHVYDVTGAGDTAASALALALAAGADLASATSLAAVAASIVVSKPGTARVSAIELLGAADPSTGEGGVTVPMTSTG